MSPTGGKTAVGEILLATEKSATIGQTTEGSRNRAGLVLEAESEESVVGVTKFLVHPNIEIVAGFLAHRIGQEVVAARVNRPRRGIQRSQPQRQWIQRTTPCYYGRSGNDVQRLPCSVVLEGYAAIRLRQFGIENLACICR